MATMALMAWTGFGAGNGPGIRAVVERHRGRLDWQPGVAVFAGCAEALAAAVQWQQVRPPEDETGGCKP